MLMKLGKMLAGATLLGMVLAGPVLLRAQTGDSDKINKLFAEIRQHAVNAESDAELLESYTRSRLHWESHAARVHSMRDHVNDLIRDFNDAKAYREQGSEWQKGAIDNIEPLLQGMAAHLTATIDHLNNNQDKTAMKPWRDYVHANREYANKTANLIRDYVEYSEAKAKADLIESKVQVPENPGQE